MDTDIIVIGSGAGGLAAALPLAQSGKRVTVIEQHNVPGGLCHSFRSGGYRYTLEPGVAGQHTADEFWFDTKAGFCEHIASAFVVLMRAAGIPARVVTGYAGAYRNPIGGYWLVRKSDAHAWAEVWLPARGWVRATASTRCTKTPAPRVSAPRCSAG